MSHCNSIASIRENSVPVGIDLAVGQGAELCITESDGTGLGIDVPTHEIFRSVCLIITDSSNRPGHILAVSANISRLSAEAENMAAGTQL